MPSMGLAGMDIEPKQTPLDAKMPGLAGANQSPGAPMFVDSIEDNMATIVTEKTDMPGEFDTQQVPLDSLPYGAQVGDTIMPDGKLVPQEQGGGQVEQKRSNMLKSDPGGDIEL